VPGNTSVNLPQIERPADVYLVMDYNEQSAATAYPGNAMKWAALAAGSTTGQQKSVTPHQMGAVACFADGHAKWVPRGQYARLGTVTNYASTCNLNSPNPTYAYCDPAWNPFLK
jgi:prepilin-type processing-associated H-X9-DG protein